MRELLAFRATAGTVQYQLDLTHIDQLREGAQLAQCHVDGRARPAQRETESRPSRPYIWLGHPRRLEIDSQLSMNTVYCVVRRLANGLLGLAISALTSSIRARSCRQSRCARRATTIATTAAMQAALVEQARKQSQVTCLTFSSHVNARQWLGALTRARRSAALVSAAVARSEAPRPLGVARHACE